MASTCLQGSLGLGVWEVGEAVRQAPLHICSVALGEVLGEVEAQSEEKLPRPKVRVDDLNHCSRQDVAASPSPKVSMPLGRCLCRK